jgi:hypothetical protein
MRVSKQDLQDLIDQLNKLGLPVELNWAYGDVQVMRRSKSGGREDVSGRGTKSEIYDYLRAMLAGVQLYQDGLRFWTMRATSWPALVNPVVYVATESQARESAARQSSADGVEYVVETLNGVNHCESLDGIRRITILN